MVLSCSVTLPAAVPRVSAPVLALPFVSGYSTTRLVQQIRGSAAVKAN